MGNRKITIQTLLKTAEANASAFENLRHRALPTMTTIKSNTGG